MYAIAFLLFWPGSVQKRNIDVLEFGRLLEFVRSKTECLQVYASKLRLLAQQCIQGLSRAANQKVKRCINRGVAPC